MIVPRKCFELIANSLISTGFCPGVSKEEVYSLARHYLDVKRLKEQIAGITAYKPIGGRFLEIGSGFGGLVTYINQNFPECNAFGIEPSADAYAGTMACTRVLAKENNIHDRFIASCGEFLPFLDNTFDIVYSTSVLEHVKAPEKVIAESIRVLKPGGILQFVIPNYGSWWEGHYGILYVPHLPKSLFKLYVRLLGRDPAFVDTLQLISKGKLKKLLKAFDNQIDVIGWGTKVWVERLVHIDFSTWASLGTLKQWVDLVHRLGLVEIIVWFGKKLHWETPLILTIRKQ